MGMFGDFLNKFKLSDEKNEERVRSNQIATSNDDGAYEYETGAFHSYNLNMDMSYDSQVELIETYRDIANYELVDYAIDDIVNEMISFTEDDQPVDLDLSELEDDLSENIRTKIYESYDKIMRLLDFKSTCHKRARQFYIDGRLSYQKVIDKNKPKDGLIGIVELDPRFVVKIRNVDYDPQTRTIRGYEEKFVYDENRKSKTSKTKSENKQTNIKAALELDPKTITYVTSGLIDDNSGFTTSWLHKAIKPVNQLRMMENALVIYRIVRAPERRVFYVDVSKLQKSKGQSYLAQLANKYRNKMSFDPERGTFKDSKHFQTMQEDFWLPRDSNGKGTEVSTLSGGENLGQIEDVQYFQRKVYKALNVPVSRLEPESTFMGGRTTEITRDELKFAKFVSKIRKRFNMMLIDLLKTDVLLRNIMTVEEWDKIEEKISFRYAQDLYLQEAQENEIMQMRLDLAQSMEPYIGKYFSHSYIRTKIFKQTDEDQKEMDEEIKADKENQQYKSSEEDGWQ